MSNNEIIVLETFFGYIETTRDALLIFEACKRGMLSRVKRRLQDKEKVLIRSGTIFCFDEKESGIKRWTDGFLWSPSRILGNFLIYRELRDKKLLLIEQNESIKRQKEKQIVGSFKHSYKYKQNGLIKKSISLIVDGVQQHIISYYNKQDIISGKLSTPSSLITLSSLQVSPNLKIRQNFRLPNTSHEQDNVVTQKHNSKKNPLDSTNQSTASESSSNHSTPQYNNDLLIMTYNDPIFSSFDLIEKEISAPFADNNIVDNICVDECFSNINQPSATRTVEYDNWLSQPIASSSGSYYHHGSQEQSNPYQHLYSSASFHSINHASILPNVRNNNLITANAFMEDINAILGWSEFELQM